MTGTLTACTAAGGAIASNTAQSCPYTFVPDQFYGPGTYDQLVADFGGGATITVNFRPNSATGIATIVRRMS